MASSAKPVGVGFVGAGMIGQVAHIANYRELPDCRAVALAELRPALGRAAAAKFGVPKVYASHRELLMDPEVQAVVVVTRRPATGPEVLEALQAGRHVLSEKPMAHTVEQAQRLVDAAARKGVRYAVGYMKRHDPGTERAKALLDELRASGELGSILLLRAWCYGGEFRCDPADYVMTKEDRPDGLATWPIAPEWLPPALAEDYAWFLNVFVHDLNIVRHLSGTEPTVSSVDLRRRNGRFVGLDFGDYPGVLEMAEIPDQPWQEGVEILFEKGALRLQFRSPLEHNSARLTLQRAGGTREIPPDSAAWCFRRQAEAFIADITQGREPLASGRDAVADLRLAEAIWRAHLKY